MSVQSAKAEVETLIERLGITAPPVNIEAIAKRLGLTVVYEDLGPDVSGLLVSKGNDAYVFIQRSDHAHRRRFSIAHEVAHFVLRHQFDGGRHVHVDRGHFISQRGPRASAGIDPKEIEANQFAACLLMPSKLIRDSVRATAGEMPLLDHHVSSLAREYEVSDQAMTIRLTTLGLL